MKLYVIGNGFDLAHGIPSKYSHFYEYLAQNKPDVLEKMGEFYYVDDESKLWSEFEESLESDIDYEPLTEIIKDNAPDIASDDFSDGDWYDAQIYIEQECDELLESVRSGFEEWIESFEISNISPKFKLDSSDIYLTFNYTKVLEDVYNIPESQILHIHNKVGEELIFGHGKNPDSFNVREALYGDEKYFQVEDEYGNIESCENGHEIFAEEAVCFFYDKMRKHTEDIIATHSPFFEKLSKVDEVIVIGHSYNPIDYPYFKKILQSVGQDTKWVLNCYKNSDKEAAKKLVKEIGIPETNVKIVEPGTEK